ncbi:MAG: hypothetical protein ACTSRW_15375 [Candidatus Helarchaeota archaeon]
MSMIDLIIQILGIIELFSAAGINFLLTMVTYLKYKQKKVRATFIFILVFFLVGFALTCIGINRIFLSTAMRYVLQNDYFGLAFHNIAIIASLVVVLLLDAFSFEMTYPTHVKELTVVSAILMGLLGIILMIFQPTIGISGEIVYADFLLLIILPLLGPTLLIPVIVFFYYAIVIRKTARPKAIRSAVMGIATGTIAMAYVFELVGIVGLITIFVRLCFVAFSILMYVCISMPVWFQNAIGWESDA